MVQNKQLPVTDIWMKHHMQYLLKPFALAIRFSNALAYVFKYQRGNRQWFTSFEDRNELMYN